MSEEVAPVIGTERIDAIDKLHGIAVAISDLLETPAAKKNRFRPNSSMTAISRIVP